MNNQKLEKAESVPVDTGVEVMENKSIVYSKIFGSTKGVLGEGSTKMKLTDKFFQCPTIMGNQLIKAIMEEKKSGNHNKANTNNPNKYKKPKK